MWDPATRLEIAFVERRAPSLPMIRSAAEIPKATPQRIGELVAYALALIKRLHGRIGIEPAAFDNANAKPRIGEPERDRETGCAGADDAQVAIELLGGGGFAEVPEHRVNAAR